MRFGRRSRNPFSWRKSPKSPQDDGDREFAPVDSTERNALLSDQEGDRQNEDADDGEVIDPVESDESPYPVDPTQRLLTALGRFQRQVARAKEGQPQELWVEDCMNHLVTAVEIAIEQGWRELVTALTETARILQSYENARQANRAAQFLAESNELLCLMVGDLIVGRIRPGVVDKWKQRYERALEELKEAGIPLVSDEEEEPSTPEYSVGDQIPKSEEEKATISTTEESGFDYSGYEVSKEADYYEYEESGEIAEVGGHYEKTEDIAQVVSDLDELDRAVESIIEDLSNSAKKSDLMKAPYEIEEEEESIASEITLEQKPIGVTAARGLPEKIVKALDNLCDVLACLAEQRDAVSAELTSELLNISSFLKETAQQEDWRHLKSPCELLTEMIEFVHETGKIPDDRFFEVVYAFCGLYGESGSTEIEDVETVENWLSEARELLNKWREQSGKVSFKSLMEREHPPFTEEASLMSEQIGAEVEQEISKEEVESKVTPEQERKAEVVEPVSTPTLSEEPNTLLVTARDLAERGNVAQAKRLALMAAARLAREQVRQAELQVQQAEQQVKNDITCVEQSRAQIDQIEAQLTLAQQRVEAALDEVERSQMKINEIVGQIQQMQRQIEEIEEQIRLLETRRVEALQKKSHTESQLREAESEATSREAELEAHRLAEQELRKQLEEARQQVKIWERKRVEDDMSLQKAREFLHLQQLSLSKIEETIAEIGVEGSAEKEAGKDLLFD